MTRSCGRRSILSKRDRTRRKVIFVISDGRERGSQASYNDVLQVLETHGIQVKAVVLDTGALPVYKQVEKLPICRARGTATFFRNMSTRPVAERRIRELHRNAIEEAYALITSEARNQYTLGYSPKGDRRQFGLPQPSRSRSTRGG